MLKRKTPLRRTGGLKRSLMKRVNVERKAKRDAEAFGEQAELCRRLPCACCSWGVYAHPDGSLTNEEKAAEIGRFQSDPHHIPTRGAGGKDKDTVPLCRAHHTEWHSIGEQSFADKHGVDLRAVASALHGELARNND